MIDASLIFSGSVSAAGAISGQAITASATSANVIDFLANRDVGAGEELEIHVQLLQAFNNLTSLQVAYQTSADNATFVDVLLSPVMLLANLILGARIMRVKVPLMGLNDTGTPNRYHRLNYTVVGTAPTTGSVFAYITGMGDRQAFYAYPAAYSA